MSTTATLSRIYALGRVVYGTGLTVRPDLFAGPWIGKDARRPAAQIGLRAMGIRDAAIGAGALLAAGDPARQRPWLAASAISDLVDMGATLAAPPKAIPPRARQAVAAFAGSAALMGAALYAGQRREAAG